MTLDVTGRRCVVFGDGPMAAAKAAALREAGADVVARDAYTPGDLGGAFLAIVSGEGPTDAAAVFAEAEERGVLLNALDDVPHCHFAFPSIVARGDLRLAVSTAGKAPALSRALRVRLGDLVDDAYGELVDILGEVREATTPRTVPFDEWAGRWRRALADLDGLLELVRDGRGDEVRRRLLDAIADREAVG